MENQGQSLPSKINYLITIAEDAKKGYANAAEDTEDAMLKKIFLSLSTERERFVTELKNELDYFGGEAAVAGEPVGETHRQWKDLKKALIGGDSSEIIKECIAGEGFALKEYEAIIETLKSDLVLSKVLVRHRNGINSALNGIKNVLNKQ